MARLLSPDDACVSADVGPYRYDGRVVDVASPRHAAVLKAIGYTEGDVGGLPTKSSGRKCVDCGFSSYFKKCSRCGNDCK